MDFKYYLVLSIHLIACVYLSKPLYLIAPSFLKHFYFKLLDYISFLLFTYLTFQFTKKRFLNDKVDAKDKAVFITGCDTGFGHLLAKRLDSKGFQVLAGCLLPDSKGAAELRRWCSQRLRVIPLDVSQDDSVNKALELAKDYMRRDGTTMWCVVNNAGVYRGISTELSRMEDFKYSMEVNAFGMVRVTRVFLPLLKKTRGRVVNVTSLVGRIAVRELTPYCLSKHAAVALNDCLRQEMKVWGVSVVSLEPELFQTQLTNNEALEEQIAATLSELPSSIEEDYGKPYFEDLRKSKAKFINYASPKVKVVVNDLESAVTLKYPDYHYKPRRSLFMRFLMFCFEVIPSYFRDICVQIVEILLRSPKPKAA
ncbi:D-beta-hydroxybutyrate dehydrogenase, mitochondrial [Araneus ventricosus]|uniref:D-beta-hydroxybutyrate dehydrogenase, mitochondrial n=1 Tax=Araneus ventricosus TaxID=182803 RepID=A0A4Y2B682_ARAVE|nr:D-beta-hydroxybutyrate dehydrogenase, mitochondrial [Araneus ventricosus]